VVSGYPGIGLVIERSQDRLSPTAGWNFCTYALSSIVYVVSAKELVVPCSWKGRLTVGLYSHWPCATYFMVYHPTGSKATRQICAPHVLQPGNITSTVSLPFYLISVVGRPQCHCLYCNTYTSIYAVSCETFFEGN